MYKGVPTGQHRQILRSIVSSLCARRPCERGAGVLCVLTLVYFLLNLVMLLFILKGCVKPALSIKDDFPHQHLHCT